MRFFKKVSPFGKGRKPIQNISIIILTGIFCFIQVYLFFLKEFLVLDSKKFTNDKAVPLFGETKTVGQEFEIKGFLSRIDIMLGIYNRKPGKSVLRLSIFNKAKRIFLKNYAASSIRDNRFYSFYPDQQKIPAGQYRLQLEYFMLEPKDKAAVWISQQDYYPSGSFYINGEKMKGDMTFRVYYRNSIWNERERWLNVNGPDSPAWFPRFALSLGLLLFVFMVNVVFVYFLDKLFIMKRAART